jgi:hypothetical protein
MPVRNVNAGGFAEAPASGGEEISACRADFSAPIRI